jgi:cell division protein FtsB
MKSLYSKLAVFTLMLLAGVYSYVSLRGPQGVPRLLEKRQQIQQLQEQNEELERQNAEKKQRIQNLGDSEAEQEIEIRRRMKVVKPGETTFIIPKPHKTAEEHQ